MGRGEGNIRGWEEEGKCWKRSKRTRRVDEESEIGDGGRIEGSITFLR